MTTFDDDWAAIQQEHLDETPPPSAKATGPSAATQLVRLAFKRYRFGVSEGGEPFAVPLSGDARHVARLLRGGQGSLRAELAGVYFDKYDKAAPQTSLADALMVLEGRALQATPEPLALRVADADGALWLDLGRTDGLVVRIDNSQWQIKKECPVLFHRTALTGVLPTPITTSADLEELWPLLNVSEDYRALITASLVAALMPNIPHPVLSLQGEQGTGKSSAARTLSGLLDPAPVQVRKPPRDSESWVTAASGSWFVAIDNLSHVPDWLSDALCRAVTGDGDVRRTLYSDAGLTVFAFRRVVILNGIDLGSLNGDLVDRLVAVQLSVIPESARQKEDVMAAAWLDRHPRILAGLLDLTVKVLAARDGVKLDGYPRMADFAHVVATVDYVTGGEGYKKYLGLRVDLAEEALASDVTLTAIHQTINEEFTGTAKDLLDKITPDEDSKWRQPKDWPKTARALTTVLSRSSPTLRRLGWTVEKTGKDPRQRAETWKITPPQGASEGASEVRANRSHSRSHSQSHSQSHSHPDTPADLQLCENGQDCERNEREIHASYLDLIEADKRDGPTGEGTYSSLVSLAPLADEGNLTLNLGQLPGRCQSCGYHIERQGHAPNCTAPVTR